MPVPIVGGVKVNVDRPGRPARYVIDTPVREQLVRLGRHLTEVGTEIKLAGATAFLRAALSDSWSMYEPCELMTITFGRRAVAIPQPYAIDVCVDGPVLLGSVRDGDGEIVASARLAGSGRYGVVDQVWTHPCHRRRGLATALVGQLANHVEAAGFDTGLLSATVEGRALYAHLGWRPAVKSQARTAAAR